MEETLAALSSAEKRIARLIYARYTAAEIASEMSYSVPNVHYHLGRIYRKFGVRNKGELRLYLEKQPRLGKVTYKSSLIDINSAPVQYRDELFYKQKRLRIVNAIYKLKFRCDSVWISSKREWQRELDEIINVIIQELS
ncbi:helix-turn-helix transcriptional regulator [Gloeocapsa sp. PCC 7428]|uniref:helix-turn-helix transcriptional regulator n=1 Tax=Gloeocapsa sp. PCC 7428 TaxID=1173026 RepID=UPI0002F7D455|nr:helix-turn-helix transcriptional regulator [Gloeocapsa sp. PCC 7428]